MSRKIKLNSNTYIIARPIMKSCFGCDATPDDCKHPSNLTCLGGEYFILVRDNEVGKANYIKNKILGSRQ